MHYLLSKKNKQTNKTKQNRQKHRKRVLNYTARKSSAPTTLKDPFYVESRHRPIKAV